MGESQFLQVESKSFEIAKHVSTLSITERSRSHVSSVSMGFLAARWCRETLLEVANLSTEKHLFRSFRERNSVFVIQKQSNVRGAFVSITVLGEYRGKGIVIIPEGRDGKGWRGVSNVIHGLLNPLVSENHDSKHRRPPTLTAQNKSNILGESRTYKDAANRGDIPKKDLPKITHVISHVIEENIPETRDSGKAVVNGSVELYLKVVLGVGSEEKWVVKWAGIMDQPNGASASSEDPSLFEGGPSRTEPLKVASKEAGPSRTKPNQPKPTQKLVWRPRSTSSAQTSQELSPSPRTEMVATASRREKSGAQIHGSGSEATRVPEVSVSNRFSIFQVGESSGTSSSADLTPPQAVCSTILTPLADASLLLSGSNSQDDGKLISPVICPLPTEVDRTWGSSSAWVLELRDGRRVSIPLSLLRQPVVTASLPTDSVDAGQLVTREELVGVGSTVDDLSSLGGSLGGSEYSGAEDESEDDISLVWEDREVDGVGSELVCWGDEAETLDVEPLAISKPVENELQEVVTHTQELEVVVSPSGVEDSSPGVEVSPSDWVLGKSKRIGKVLGASYHGNEERINRLLMEIDGRRPQISCEVGGVKKLKEGRKGTRELKRLTCSINYESESAKSRGKSRERVLSISQ